MPYIYQADVWCDSCGERIKAELARAGQAPEDPMDHYSYDSDEYPKDADIEHEEADTPQHCSKCDLFFRNPLTSEGYQYVQSELNDLPALTTAAKLREAGHPFLADWANWYSFLYWDAEDCADDVLGKHPKPGWYSSESF